MIDSEVQRLRQLRGSALRVRAVALALGRDRKAPTDSLLNAGACAAWRVARAVTGRLRAHPYAPYQKGATLGMLVRNSIAARAALLASSTRAQALEAFEGHLKVLLRELDDARALTRASDLSDTFGRYQSELRVLVNLLGQLLHGAYAHDLIVELPAAAPPTVSTVKAIAPAYAAAVAVSTGSRSVDWPYLAI